MRGRAIHRPVAVKQYGTPCWFTRPEEFSPANVPGLVLWLAASDGATLFQTSSLDTPAVADGDPVGGWKNRVAGAYHALQATSGRRPLLRLNAVHGLPLVEFDGSDDYLAISRMTGQFAAGMSYFLAMKFADGRPSGTRRPFGARSSLPVQSYFTSILTSSGNLSHATWIDSEFYENAYLNLPDAETAWHVLSTVATPGSDVTSYVDGVESGTSDISEGTWANLAGAVAESPFLGADNNATSPSGPHTLRLAEVLIYGAALDAASRAAVEHYLLAKYGLS